MPATKYLDPSINQLFCRFKSRNILVLWRHLVRLQIWPTSVDLPNGIMPYPSDSGACSGQGACLGFGQLLWAETVTASSAEFVTTYTSDLGPHNVSLTLNGQDFHYFPDLQFTVSIDSDG